jgi:hypothetical protein
MAPAKKSSKQKSTASASAPPGAPPKPFKPAPESLLPFINGLDEKHVYITHIDTKPAAFKKKIFLVPALMNVATALLFIWRMNYILPYYYKLFVSGLGLTNETTFQASAATWSSLLWEISKRGFSFMIDFMLFIFVWPWPVEFVMGRTYGNPVQWRWKVGFREKEIYVRRSREWDKTLSQLFINPDVTTTVLTLARQATSSMLIEQKTGYLTMNGEWDLDWASMVHATQLVDKKVIALEAFRTVVLVHHRDYGWLCYDTKQTEGGKEDDRRRQVFAFRDALAAVGKEDLFFRWIEMVQFESTQPGGFGPEKQEAAAQKIRDLFEKEGINFDEFWQEAVGSATSAGI